MFEYDTLVLWKMFFEGDFFFLIKYVAFLFTFIKKVSFLKKRNKVQQQATFFIGILLKITLFAIFPLCSNENDQK